MRKSHLTMLFIALLVLVIGLSVSWTDHHMTTQQKNKDLVTRFFEKVWSEGNIDLVGELVSEDYLSHHHRTSEQDIKGVDGLKQYVTANRSAFPDLMFVIEDQIAEGDKVVTRWTAHGMNKGAYMGQPATGKHAKVTGISITRIANGKIAESWGNWDELGLMQQLGVIPAPAMETVTLAVTGMA